LKKTNIAPYRQKEIAEKIENGDKVEVYFCTGVGLDLEVDGDEVLTAKEFHLTLAEDDGSAIIRCNEIIGETSVWHDIHISNFSLYSVFSRSK
tara:strand:+ start:1127 stop:1405 length:279 start_codon:yes stop_codon:yes gene_type:complete